MRYGSLCSGIEAASVAFGPLGWEAAWFSEIEAFPNAVLAHHYPGVANHGDMTTIRERILSGEIEAPDMICGGPPCQAFSVAGLRRSLDDERGNLTLEYVKICDATDAVRLAAGRPPAWILYENVPGILNTKDNAFGALLGGLCGSDTPIVAPAGWGRSGVVNGPTRTVAYRVLNAEHFGLAQRRKRVFVLAKGGSGRWAAADALLPIIESSRWHPAPSRGAGEGVAATITSGAANGGPAHGARSGSAKEGNLIPATAHTLTAGGRETGPHGALDGVNLIAHTVRGEGFDASEDGTGRGVPLVPDVAGTMMAGAESGGWSNSVDHAAAGYMVPVVMAPTLSCNHEAPILMRMREGKEGGGKGPLVSEDQSLTLATGNDQVLAYPINTQLGLRGAETSNSTREGIGIGNEGDPSFTLQAAHSHAVAHGMQVRRFTPIETARLQGFPDTYCHIPTAKWRKIPTDEAAYLQSHGLHAELRGQQWYTNIAADGPIYKANGNSWAVPCARWIGERIKAIRP